LQKKKNKKEKCFEISSHALALVQIVVGIEPRSLTTAAAE